MPRSVLAIVSGPVRIEPGLRAFLRAATLSALLVLMPILVPTSQAAIVGCGSDPTFILSNGTELDLSATIEDSSADVQQVDFTLHVPVGTTVLAYVAGSLGAVETWRVVDDYPPLHYGTITRVSTYTRGISVTAVTQAIGLLGVALIGVTGEDHQNLTATLSM